MIHVDWYAIASVLSQRVTTPLVVLDKKANIRFVNDELARLFGMEKETLFGRPASEIFETPRMTSTWVGDVLRGARPSARLTVRAARARLALDVDLSVVGNASKSAILASVVRVVRSITPSLDDLPRSCDLDYEVSADSRNFGSVARISVNGDRVPQRVSGSCFEVLYGRADKCSDCPIPAVGAERGVSVRPSGVEADAAFDLMSAEWLENGVARIRRRPVTEQELAALQAARLTAALGRARLTVREEQVLGLLVCARTAREIGAELGISVRTVKHHQASGLRKLGAKSRTDLLRILR